MFFLRNREIVDFSLQIFYNEGKGCAGRKKRKAVRDSEFLTAKRKGNGQRMIKKVFWGVFLLVLLCGLVWLGARYSWRLRGFSACSETMITTVSVDENGVLIAGENPSPAGRFVGCFWKEDGEGNLYVGVRYNVFLGFFPQESGSFWCRIPVKAQVRQVFYQYGDTQSLIWSADRSTAAEGASGAPQPSSEGDSLGLLRKEMGEADCAVAYVGYVESGEMDEILAYVSGCGLREQYPFLGEIAEADVVLAGGGEIYCIVPASEQAALSVRELGLGDSGKEVQGPMLYQGDARPILLVCNVSDIMPNARVTVLEGEKLLEFSPFISLRDGNVTVLPDTKPIYIFGNGDGSVQEEAP